MNRILTFLLCFVSSLLIGQTHPDLGFEVYSTGFDEPVDIANANDGSNRLFIVEKAGRIQILQPDCTINTTPFLDIDPSVSSSGERGLLGLAFHPNYASNGYFYINYTDNSGATQIVRYQVSANPDVADAASATVVLSLVQPFSNHNAGDLEFGPDGYLYIPLGDGGAGGDPGNRSQDITNQLLGKLIRIDVDGDDFPADTGRNYAIPASNPLVGATGDDEIWSIGLRNPWRFSFDRQTGDMWIADVGQGDWEEVNFAPANSGGGENYGWRCYEGNAAYNTTGCAPASSYLDPVFEYDHVTGGFSITGGYVYRGMRYECLQGAYICIDYYTNNAWTTLPNGAAWSTQLHNPSGVSNVSTFGEDEYGELYAASLSNGEIYRVIDTKALAVELKVLLQGAYDNGSGMMNDALRSNNLLPNTDPYGLGYKLQCASSVLAITGANAIVDWVKLELRDQANPSTALETRPALIQRDGDVVDVDGMSNVTFNCEAAGNYHIAVLHRNHLGVMTQMPVTIN